MTEWASEPIKHSLSVFLTVKFEIKIFCIQNILFMWHVCNSSGGSFLSSLGKKVEVVNIIFVKIIVMKWII